MIQGHKIAVLQFSGGKDSLACLWMLKEHWHELIVIWVDTGDSAPEVRDQVENLESVVQQVIIVKSNMVDQQKLYGPPSDLLPVWDTFVGRKFDKTRRDYFQTPFSCCGENIWGPLEVATKATGATLIIRGQRSEESKKAEITSGHNEDGVEYWFPLEDWTEHKVRAFLESHGQRLPVSYNYFNSSPDCLTCTAYLEENVGKGEWLMKYHPAAAVSLRKKLVAIHTSSKKELELQRGMLGELDAS